jgi:phage gp37-like protein
MKVKELIELLQQCDQETLVVVDGYEGDYDDCHFHNIKLDLNTGAVSWIGSHSKGSKVDAIVISRFEDIRE